MKKPSKLTIRGWLALAVAPMLLPAVAMAEPLLLESPADPPAAPAAPSPAPAVPVPVTAPVAAAPQNPLVDPRLQDGKILILPFQAVNTAESNPWVGKSIQQSMVADLTVLAPNRVITADQFAPTVEAAIALGHQNGARFVVAGGYATIDRELRITGQVLDVESGRAVAALKVTGLPSQIFRMEDALAMQVRGQLLPADAQGQIPQQQPYPRQEPQQPQPVPAAQQPGDDPNGVRSDSGSYTPVPQPQQYYSTYATAPAPPVYGGGDYSNTYTYYQPTAYVYDAYPYYGGYADYGYGWPFVGFGLGLSFYGGHGFYGYHNYGRGYERGGEGRHNYVYSGGGYRGSSYSNGYPRAGLSSGGVRSSAFSRGSSYSGYATASRGSSSYRSSAAPYRSPAFYDHGSSFGRSSGYSGGGSSHSFGSGSSHSFSSGGGSHSFGGGGGGHGGGGGGHGGGGGGHGGGGGGHGGGGHR